MQRPKRRENEEDLLRFQEQFMQRGIEPSAKVQRMTPKDSAITKTSDEARDIVSLHENGTGRDLNEMAATKKSRFKINAEKSSKMKAKKDQSAPELLEEKDNHITTMLSRIKERPIKPFVMKQKRFEGGFPSVPQLMKDIVTSDPKGATKQSLFARQFMSGNIAAFGLEQEGNVSFDCQSGKISSKEKGEKMNDYKPPGNSMEAQTGTSEIVTGQGLAAGPDADNERHEIERENTRKLAEMTENEILEEKAKLEAAMDPRLLAFVKSKRVTRHKEGDISNRDVKSQGVIVEHSVDEVSSPNAPEASASEFDPREVFGIDKGLLNMDIIEDEKLQWIKDAPKVVQKGDVSAVARFDLEGKLVPKDADLPSNLGLHHHGDDPSLPGYSLEELFHLARSNFLQQRVFALRILGKVLEEYYQGSFDGKLQECIMEKLLDAGMPFLLRWAMDDATDAVNRAAIYALSALLNNPYDHAALCELLYIDGGLQVPCLKPLSASDEIKRLKREEGREVADPEIIAIDLIKGLLKMQLLPRLRYILEISEPDDTTVNYSMTILHRIALHSRESSYEILKCPRLMQVIFTKFLPITWSDTEGTVENMPFCKALRLLRIMCLAGKSISSKLWNDFDLSARILRYVSSVNEDSFGLSDVIDLATESLHIWRVCLLLGVASSTTIAVYPLITSLLQKFVLSEDEKYQTLRSSLVLLVEAMVQMTAVESVSGTSNMQSSKKVHFDDEPEEQSPNLDWNIVSGVDSIMWQSILNMARSFSSTDMEMKLELRYMACTLLYLAAYADNASKQKSVDKVRLLSEIEKWMSNVLADIASSKKTRELVGDLIKYSEFAKPFDTLSEKVKIKSFPNHGMTKSMGMSYSIESPIAFLSAFTKLLHRVAVINKGCSSQMLPFLKEQGLLEYLKGICSTTSATYRLSMLAISSLVERRFLCNVLSLFQVTISCVGVSQMDDDLVSLYHLSAFKLISILHQEESHDAMDLMRNIIFHRSMYRNTPTENVTEMLKRLDLSSHPIEQLQDNFDLLIQHAKDSLPQICSVYLAHCFVSDASTAKQSPRFDYLHKDSFLLRGNDGALLPIDWLFFPILNLYNMAVNMELSGRMINNLTTDAVKTLEMCLSMILLLEICRPEVLDPVSPSFKLVRILCVFMIGNDAFLEPPIQNLLAVLAKIYTKEENLQKLSFEERFPGISSFYDLYVSLILQFSGTSFGDPLFSNYLLIPLQQKHDVKYRKAVWGENCETLRFFSLPLKSVSMSLSNFLEPVEEDEEMMQLYLASVNSGLIRPKWCPLFYLIAVHHLSSYVFGKVGTMDFSHLKIEKKRILFLGKILKLQNEEAKLDVLLYEKADLSSPKGFNVYKKLPGYRQLIIENRDKGNLSLTSE